MAKSLRSKWRRKCRAIKRERYGKKELERLKKTLGVDDSNEINMKEISDIATVTDVKSMTHASNENDEQMETDVSKFNRKTLRNENGTYPVWLHPRKIPKSKKAKKTKGKKKRR